MIRRRVLTALAVLLGLLAPLVAVGATAPAQAADTGVAYGTIKFPNKDNPALKVLWFTQDWTYLGTANANGGSYYLTLAPDTYHLQFVDQRAAYNTAKYAPTDVQVTVPATGGVRKNVTMTKGAVLTGTVKAHGKVAKKAKVVAANQAQNSFSTTANGKGQFALGGLPEGKYSVFTYDHKHGYAGKSLWAGKLKPGKSKNVAINLKQKAGSLRVALFTSANGVTKPVSGHPTVTAVSKKTGQWWSKEVKGGSAVFQGLYPGKYTLVANGYGVWFAKTAAVQGDAVKAGRAGFGKFTYTQRGGWLTGTVTDGSNPSISLAGATVQLWSAAGTKLDETSSDDSGAFTLDGALATQSDLTVVVQPGQYTDYLGQQGQECQYVATSHPGQSVTTGQQTELGSMTIDRKPGGNCNAPLG